MSSSKISTFKKDKNLKLNKADCDKFLKDFQKYTKKEIDHVVNPKTNRKLIDSDKIFFLNDHCQNLIGVSGQEDIIEVQIKEYEDILQLVRNRELIKNLFNQKVKTIDKSIQLFKTYADNNPTDKYIIFYNEINVEIVHLLKNELNISYSFTRNFNILEVNRKDLFSKLQNINIYNEIFSLLTKYIQSIILKSEGYTTAKHVFAYIENNMPKYIAIMFLLVVLMDYTKHTDTHFHKQLDILTDIVDYIMLNKFVIKYGNNYSLSKSPEWSLSPLSTSKKLKYRETKKNLLKHILEQCENDYDPFTMEEFEDFSLKKLKQIIIIKTTQKHSYGFYAKTLYQYWQTKHLEKEPFTNPYTRKDFTEEEKDLIVHTMSNIYPDIEGPSSDFIRPDLKMYIFITPENTFIFTMYFKIAEQLILLINIQIHHSIVVSDDVPPEYNIVFLREKLRSFFSTNKLISKSIPFKIHPVLQKYDHINTLSDYIDFCSSLI